MGNFGGYISNTIEALVHRPKHVPIKQRFLDCERSVDFVLAYNIDDTDDEKEYKRQIFEANLEKEGLHLERDTRQRIHFVKLHAPLEVLTRYSEILKIKLPMKSLKGQTEKSDHWLDTIKKLRGRYYKSVNLDPRNYRIYCEFSRNYLHLFDWENPTFFDASIRNSIINSILERQPFFESEDSPDNSGIEKLIQDQVYVCAYTLHDDNDRDLLLREWASVRKWKELQPLDKVKDYFGPKVALYFAWLGFYTHMLILVSITGILCFLYGFATWSSDPISNEICNENKTTLMCPQCDKRCDFWKLQDTCSSSRINYLIDNKMTVLFAFVISVWAVVYLELWKRYSTRLMHRWGLIGFSHEVEHPRPQYLSKLHKARKTNFNYINNVLEPDVSFWKKKFLSDITSYSIMVLFICISIIAIFSLIVYRMAQRASYSVLGNEDTTTYRILLLPLTTGVIDLIVISLLDFAYSYLAVFLTDLEYRRTQTEYNESLTIKNYVFQFVNYYTSLFYIAFLKGKFVGYPGKYNRILGFRQEECAPGGCLMELFMQLVVIMVGKQTLNAVIEMSVPYVKTVVKKVQTSFGRKKGGRSKDNLISNDQWTEDYHLMPWTRISLYSEYLEMVLQFGFVTLFGLAFPLAPLLALINNVIEMRLDAFKMLRFFRRPVAQRIRNIGVWYNIMSIISKLSVVSSAVIIAFSTNLIPKIVYRLTTHDESCEGYLNFTLAYFNTVDFQVKPEGSLLNVTTCRYTDLRNPPWHEQPYKRPPVYWTILAARLAFIVIFQNIVGFIQVIVAWSIPDVPRKLLKQIKREDLLLREIIIEYERKLAAKGVHCKHPHSDRTKDERNFMDVPWKFCVPLQNDSNDRNRDNEVTLVS